MHNKIYWLWKYVALLFVITVIVGYYSIDYLQTNLVKNQGGMVDIVVETEDKVDLAQDFQTKIKVYNAQKDTIQNLKIRLNYPNGFVFRRSNLSAENSSNNSFIVSSLSAGDEFLLEIDGTNYSPEGSHTIYAYLEYELPNFRSALESKNEESYSSVYPEIEVKVVDGQEMSWIVFNKSNKDLVGAKLFVAVEAPLSVDQAHIDNGLDLPELVSEEEVKIALPTITGGDDNSHALNYQLKIPSPIGEMIVLTSGKIEQVVSSSTGLLVPTDGI